MTTTTPTGGRQGRRSALSCPQSGVGDLTTLPRGCQPGGHAVRRTDIRLRSGGPSPDTTAPAAPRPVAGVTAP